MCTRSFARHIVRDLDALHPQRPEHWCYEWKNVRTNNFERYKKFIDLFFEYNSSHHIDFRCIVIDCSNLDHASFNDGDGDLGFNKFLYQHLLSHHRAHGDGCSFHSYHDRRTSIWSLDEIKRRLNNKTSAGEPTPKRRYPLLAYSDKRIEPLLQFADVLIGAIGFAWNEKAAQFPGAKCDLAEYTRRSACLPTLAAGTPLHKQHFNIWPFRLSEAPREPSALEASAL